LAEYRLDRLSSGEQTGRALAASQPLWVIASQFRWGKENNISTQTGQDEMFQPLGTKGTAGVSRLPHAHAVILKLSDLDGICPRQAENATRRILQVLTTAVVLVMVYPHDMAALRIYIDR
jgi:hypothetical protein